MKKTLLLGTTPDRKNKKRVKFELSPTSHFDGEVYTLDLQGEESSTHAVMDLENLHAKGVLPYGDETFDEIHAYEIIEHYGLQGDFRGFFREFGEFWRILKPEGLMMISCPMWDSPWSIGDPGHCRIFAKQSFSWLVEDHYTQIDDGSGSACTDYRAFVDEKWWQILGVEETTDQLFVILQKQ